MLKDGSRLYKIETTLAALSGVLGVLTFFWHDWLEVTGWDPDHHNGSAEWVIAVVLDRSCAHPRGYGAPGAPAQPPRRRRGVARSADRLAAAAWWPPRAARLRQRMLIRSTMHASRTKNARSITAVRIDARST